MIPGFLIKPLIYLSLVASYTAIVWWHGYDYSLGLSEEAALIQANKNAEAVSTAVKETEDATRRIYEEEIRRLKNRKPLPDNCVLSPDFRRLHDAAAGLPESPKAGSVAAQAVADTIEHNYLACRQNIIWLKECQKICQ